MTPNEEISQSLAPQTQGNISPAAPIAAASIPASTPAPAAPAAPAALPVAHQSHPFWSVLLKTLTILAAVAPPVVAVVTHGNSPAAESEASQLSAITSAVLQGFQQQQ
jgi:hypothetical protein